MLKDQKELLSEFNAHRVEYLIVGGHAVNAHGVPRATKDLDVLVRPDPENSGRVYQALASFGAPLDGISPLDFCGKPDQILQIGVEPHRVDILQSIPGVTFDEAVKNHVVATLSDGVTAPFLGKEDLIRNKEQSGRPRDLADVAELRAVVTDTQI